MKELHWFEAKQLDRVTNFSTETEILKAANTRMMKIQYYCTFSKKREYYNLRDNINYLGFFKNRIIKAFEFQLLVIIKSIRLIVNSNNRVLMVNQSLIKNILPAYFINKWLRKKNKFMVDIRTIPTNPETFIKDMAVFHSKFKYVVKYFDGLSFITPFMEKYLLANYKTNIPSVNWSSGVDTDLFNAETYSKTNNLNCFTIFYHGGISESRGNLNLIKACEKLIYDKYNIKLVQIGICVDKSITDYIEDNKLESWCKLMPPVSLEEIPQLIANCDLPVLPFPNFMAWRVSSPIKLMEYLAMGKKVLAPNMESFTDVFGANSNLIFYYNTKCENPIDELIVQFIKIIDNSLLENASPKENINFVKNNYTWSLQANKLLNFVMDL